MFAITIIIVILQFITSILLSFLVLGCIDKSSRYSNNYLLHYQFNKTSPLFQHLSTAAHSTISKNHTFQDIQVGVSYYGVCLQLAKGQLNCTNYNSLHSFPDYSLTILNKTKLDLVRLAQQFSKVCHPKVLLATILLSLVALLILCYVVIPCLPFRYEVKRWLMGLTGFNVIFWGIGAMLQHQAVRASTVMMKQGSMELISAKMGSRAESITWVAFSFNILIFFGVTFDWVREYKLRKAAGVVPGKV
ncbi:hypothetical protein JA1_000052 [Spathaspora sp. JA1]|nr:hypothetical protein JA1_000052 [Spathaspora sp. JA1]